MTSSTDDQKRARLEQQCNRHAAECGVDEGQTRLLRAFALTVDAQMEPLRDEVRRIDGKVEAIG
eukprot:7022698-Lingulodinium_polyedra.AAC.1